MYGSPTDFSTISRLIRGLPLIVLVKGLENKKIIQIACGQQHCAALDSEGYVSSMCTPGSSCLMSLRVGSFMSGDATATVVWVWGLDCKTTSSFPKSFQQ